VPCAIEQSVVRAGVERSVGGELGAEETLGGGVGDDGRFGAGIDDDDPLIQMVERGPESIQRDAARLRRFGGRLRPGRELLAQLAVLPLEVVVGDRRVECAA
jgi:hypothetical protein